MTTFSGNSGPTETDLTTSQDSVGQPAQTQTLKSADLLREWLTGGPVRHGTLRRIEGVLGSVA